MEEYYTYGTEELRSELQGVMHFVDKWFDDPDYKDNPTTRSADAREIALQAIEQEQKRVAYLTEILEYAILWLPTDSLKDKVRVLITAMENE